MTRDRFLPVKTTNDLLVLRSDCYRLDESHHLVLEDGVDAVPFVDLDATHYKLVGEFDERFPDGVPSLRGAEELVVDGRLDLRRRRDRRRAAGAGSTGDGRTRCDGTARTRSDG